MLEQAKRTSVHDVTAKDASNAVTTAMKKQPNGAQKLPTSTVHVYADADAASKSEAPSLQGFDEDTLRFLVTSLVSGDTALQRYVIDNYTTEDVEFVHYLGSTVGREHMFQVYRAATTFLDYQVTFHDIIQQRDKAVIWVDLKVKMQIPYVRRKTFPTLVVLYFKQDPKDGRTKVCRQHDHHSIFFLSSSGDFMGKDLSTLLVRPALGTWLTFQGAMVQRMQALMNQAYYALGIPVDDTPAAHCKDDDCAREATAQIARHKVLSEGQRPDGEKPPGLAHSLLTLATFPLTVLALFIFLLSSVLP